MLVKEFVAEPAIELGLAKVLRLLAHDVRGVEFNDLKDTPIGHLRYIRVD